MKKHTWTIGALILGLSASAQAALFVDDFSSDPLGNITTTVILDTDTGGGSNTAALQWTPGSISLNTTAYQSIEQSAHIYNGVSLGVGEEVIVSIDDKSGNQDFGVYVGGSAPLFNVRQNYVNVYARDGGQVLADRFTDAAGAVFTDFQDFGVDYRGLFIARTDTSDYELGYYVGDEMTRVVAGSLLGATDIDGSFVGFYTDVRGSGVLGAPTQLEVIPEPSIALLGLVGLAGLARRRR